MLISKYCSRIVIEKVIYRKLKTSSISSIDLRFILDNYLIGDIKISRVKSIFHDFCLKNVKSKTTLVKLDSQFIFSHTRKSIFFFLNEFVNLKYLRVHEIRDNIMYSKSFDHINLERTSYPHFETFIYLNTNFHQNDVIKDIVHEIFIKSPNIKFVYLDKGILIHKKTTEYLISNCEKYFNKKSDKHKVVLYNNGSFNAVSGCFILNLVPYKLSFYPKDKKKHTALFLYKDFTDYLVCAKSTLCLDNIKRTLNYQWFPGYGWGIEKFSLRSPIDDKRRKWVFSVQIKVKKMMKVEEYEKYLQVKKLRNKVQYEIARNRIGKFEKSKVFELNKRKFDVLSSGALFYSKRISLCGIDWEIQITVNETKKKLKIFMLHLLSDYVVCISTISIVLDDVVKTISNVELLDNVGCGIHDLPRFRFNDNDSVQLRIFIKSKNIMTKEKHKLCLERRKLENFKRYILAKSQIGKYVSTKVKLRVNEGAVQEKFCSFFMSHNIQWRIDFYPSVKDSLYSSVYLTKFMKGYVVEAIATVKINNGNNGKDVYKFLNNGVFLNKSLGWKRFSKSEKSSKKDFCEFEIIIKLIDIEFKEQYERNMIAKRKETIETMEKIRRRFSITQKDYCTSQKDVVIKNNDGMKFGICCSDIFYVFGIPWKLMLYLKGPSNFTSLYLIVEMSDCPYAILASVVISQEENVKKLSQLHVFENNNNGWGWVKYLKFEEIGSKPQWNFKVTITVFSIMKKIEYEEFKRNNLLIQKRSYTLSQFYIKKPELIHFVINKSMLNEISNEVYQYRKDFKACKLKWFVIITFKKNSFSFYLFKNFNIEKVIIDKCICEFTFDKVLTKKSNCVSIKEKGFGWDQNPLTLFDLNREYDFLISIEILKVSLLKD